jgi:hypothetical protein
VLRVRVSSTAEGSAKPSELAKALGVWGSEDPRAEHALVARLGVVEAISPRDAGADVGLRWARHVRAPEAQS